MCGILGLIGARQTTPAGDFDAALDLLEHRGPDDRGIFHDDRALLGHRRLSILDLSPAGHQPMLDVESGASIVFNGEIYNYIELRDELKRSGHVFHSQTDTEVLLRAYLHWGVGCLQRLNGMWAFAIWQPAEGKLFFARDRFGVKPFYYTHDKGLCFASEPKAILRLRPKCRTANSRTLTEFLAWGRLHGGDASFYSGVSSLSPAHCGEYRVDRDELKVWRYWDYPSAKESTSNFSMECEEFAALIDDATRIRLRSDVPVGVTLSGGLDSTAILAAAMKFSRGPLSCFTAVYDERNRGESKWATLAASRYGIEPVEVTAPKAQWTDLLTKISWHMDGPGYSPAVFPLWNIMKHARAADVPVLLEGQGADEALAGYPQYLAVAIRRQIGLAALHPTVSNLRELRLLTTGASRTFSLRWILLWLAREIFPVLIGPYRARVGAGAVLRPEFRLPLRDAQSIQQEGKYSDTVNDRLWIDHATAVLPGLLQYGDAISMAHSVESRLPFMDYRLVEWLFSRGSQIKLGNGRSKRILRAYLENNGQKSIADRADKLGFPTPAEQWLAQDNGAILRETLLQPDSRIREFCQLSEIRRLIDIHCSGRQGAGNHLYRLLSTELWMRQCLT